MLKIIPMKNCFLKAEVSLSAYKCGSRAQIPGFKTWLHHLINVTLGKLFCLGFLIYKLQTIVAPASKVVLSSK